MSGDGLVSVKSAITGIFYRSPAPEQPSYVEVGAIVKKGQVLCLLETMKVFTKVKAPVDGEVAEILVENETAVKMNQTLFKIKT